MNVGFRVVGRFDGWNDGAFEGLLVGNFDGFEVGLKVGSNDVGKLVG